MLTVGALPVGVDVGIEDGAWRLPPLARTRPPSEQVVREEVTMLRVERLERLHVAIVEEPVARRRHVEQQLAVAADGAEVEPHQVVGAAHPLVLSRVPEPARPDRDVRFARAPDRARAGRPASARDAPRARRTRGAARAGSTARQSGRAGLAGLVADPADVRPASLNITAFGCRRRTAAWMRGQS